MKIHGENFTFSTSSFFCGSREAVVGVILKLRGGEGLYAVERICLEYRL